MSAAVLKFPAKVQRQAKKRRNAVEVAERHNWMMDNASKWETTQTDGRKPINPRVEWLVKVLYEQEGRSPPSTEELHTRNVADRQRIEKRNAAKAWLASLGADLKSLKDAEQALFFAFDKLA